MSIWWRIPALVRAVATGLFVGGLGTLAWARLVSANIKVLPTIPWATPAMALILVAWWLYFAKGRGWPDATAESRRRCARANRVPEHLWGQALGTGALGLLATLLLQGVLGRLVVLPQQREIDPSQYPLLTVFAWVVTSAAVSGVVEETAFRGYIQGGIERRHGIATAILVTGSLFGLIHFTHPEVGLVLLPYYLAVSTVYGLLAAATNSTYPSMVLHAGGNAFSAFSLLTHGRSEWQLTAVPQPTIWQSGVDSSFWVNLAMLAIAGVAAALAYRELFRASAAATPAPN